MSLRFRLIGLVAVVLVVSLIFGGAIAGFNASRSVRTEMRSALLVGRQTIENALAALPNSSDPARDLERLLASFRGNRHLRISLVGGPGGRAVAAVEPAADRTPFGAVPAWFVRLIGVPPTVEEIPIALDGGNRGSIRLESDPRNEMLEVWDEFSDSLLMLALFSGLIVLLTYLFVGRALRPLGRLAAALEEVGHGAYDTRVAAGLTTELAPLHDSFNRMAACLAAMDAENRRLNDQLLTLQEEERSDLARDLHDEVSPFLFTINVDASNIARLARENRVAEVPGLAQSIAEAVRHLQQQVRSMLGRLRPIGLAEFGLAAALGDMVAFWRRRYRDIDFRLSIGPQCEGFGELADITVYRVVQESLSNAVRHGEPRTVSIAIALRPAADPAHDSEVAVEVSDDGRGMDKPYSLGFGLRGMRERVRAMGGQLTISEATDGGLAVAATLPCPRREPAPQLSVAKP